MAATQAGSYRGARTRRALATETKPSIMSTEFYVWAATVAAILVAGAIIDGGATADTLTGQRVWLYVAIVSAAYMISRGLAKSGSRYPQANDRGDARDRDMTG